MNYPALSGLSARGTLLGDALKQALSSDGFPLFPMLLFLPGELGAHLSQRGENEIKDEYTNADKKKNKVIIHI